MLREIVTATEFWAALFGALAAFILEALRRWNSENSRRVSALNMGIVTLSQMFTVLKNYHDQVFADARGPLTTLLRREPMPFEYRPAFGVATQDLRLPRDELSSLLGSHDPNIVTRVLGAERIYLGWRLIVDQHNALHVQLQRRLAASTMRDQPATVGEVRAVVGPDLFTQIDNLGKALRDDLPRDLDRLISIGQQLRDATRYRFPVRAVVQFEHTERTDIAERHDIRQPKVCVRVTRYIFDAMRRLRGC